MKIQEKIIEAQYNLSELTRKELDIIVHALYKMEADACSEQYYYRTAVYPEKAKQARELLDKIKASVASIV